MMSAARSMTRLDDGETSMAFSFSARPFIQRDSAAYVMSAYPIESGFDGEHTSS
jgi:hypothetical protein